MAAAPSDNKRVKPSGAQAVVAAAPPGLTGGVGVLALLADGVQSFGGRGGFGGTIAAK